MTGGDSDLDLPADEEQLGLAQVALPLSHLRPPLSHTVSLCLSVSLCAQLGLSLEQLGQPRRASPRRRAAVPSDSEEEDA